jgi:DNA repair exonuclease SbcCD ATPase subunit
VFEAIPNEDRLGATSFAELRQLRLEEIFRVRADHLETIQRLSEMIAQEEENRTKLPAHEKRLEELGNKITKDEKDLRELLPKEKKAETERLATVQAVLEARTKELQQLRLGEARLQELEREYARLRQSWQRDLEDLGGRYALCGLTEGEWAVLAPRFDADAKREAVFTGARSRIDALVKAATIGRATSPTESDLSKLSLKALQDRQSSLTQAIGVEKERAKKHLDLSRRLAGIKQEREKLEREVVSLRSAGERRKTRIDERRQRYAEVFETLVAEESILDQLYTPLRRQLEQESGEEKKLEFHVRRRVDIRSWVGRGEALLDLRKAGTFRGHGSLEKAAEDLIPAWRKGGAAEVAAAMEKFIGTYMPALVAAKSPDVPLQDVGRWLFSTDHVNLEYGIKYDGVDISRLSPGMRGIVLLMLYLAVDQWDTRPLLVDQPEENLDPHSVYEELVKYFRAAKRRRQVILVTHNPNLVVNADADQVIIAKADRQDPNLLPNIFYASGGLEDKVTRSEVCRILEGGERAFLERERRYSLPRNPRTP